MIQYNDLYLYAPIKHSVIILTYNQENSVIKTLNSILNQNVLPFEIIIGDDASTDNTFNIIKEYQKKNPKIIKAFSHSKNLGIFPNQNFLMEKVSGDIVSFIAGDDIFRPDLFYELNRIIIENEINLTDNFVIVTNTTSVDIQGKEILFDNYKYKHKNAFKQRIRYSLNYRSVGISANLLKKVGPILEYIGYHADWIWSLKIDYLSNSHYYTPFISSVYHTGIGVISKTKRHLLAESMFKVLDIIKDEFKKDLDNKDLLYLKLVTAYEKYQICPSIKNYVIYFNYFILNISNLDSNNFMMNYKNFIPKQVLSKLIKLKYKLKEFK